MTLDKADDYYRVLNVDRRASSREIREAYLRLRSAFGSGNHASYSLMTPEEADRAVVEIEDAFNTLQDDRKRASYDRELESQDSKAREASSRLTLAPPHRMEDSLQVLGLHVANSSHDSEVSPEPSSTVRPVPLVPTHATGVDAPTVREEMARLLAEADLGDGEVLRKLRTLAGVSLEEIQERTKILGDYIRAMEENRYARLPQVVYVRGFLRSYMKYLAVPDGDRVVKAFAARMDEWRATQPNN